VLADRPDDPAARWLLDAAERRLPRLPPPLPPAVLERLRQAAWLIGRGRLGEALEIHRQVLLLAPLAPVLLQAADLQLQAGRRAEAAASYAQGLALAWDLPEAHRNQALALAGLGRQAEAADRLRIAVALRPERADWLAELGSVLAGLGRGAEAVACLKRAVALAPDLAEAHALLALALAEAGETEAALAAFRKVAALRPDRPETHYNLGNALRAAGQPVAAAAAFRQAVALRPGFGEAWNNLGSALRDGAEIGEAVAAFERAVALLPAATSVRSNLLCALQYDPAQTPETLLAAHRAYGALFPAPAAPAIPADRDPARRLRIGYLSPDLRAHPVGYFLLPVLPAHDRGAVEVTCYHDRGRGDAVTEALRTASDRWRDTAGLDLDRLEAVIRADAIDILVDLAGHTAGNRLPLFARRPAPVQASWAGYVGTTGLPAVGWLLSDAVESPPGAEAFAVERILRLPDGYVCFARPAAAPEVAPPPLLAAGRSTFGCFNNLAKVNDAVLLLWGRLLAAVPGACLLLKGHGLGEAAARERLAARAAAAGIAPERLVLEGPSPAAGLLAAYGRVDVALDPFPYSGGLTTLESLWMGVPVVTLGGRTFAGRHTMTHLTQAGLAELIADGPDAYVRIAAGLVADSAGLTALRAGLRARVADSPLCDGRRFAAHLEAAFRRMWAEWCAGAPAGTGSGPAG
jgi:predicted O-linked N-acetylglucosamine transferase (SPINDLY family)